MKGISEQGEQRRRGPRVQTHFAFKEQAGGCGKVEASRRRNTNYTVTELLEVT